MTDALSHVLYTPRPVSYDDDSLLGLSDTDFELMRTSHPIYNLLPTEIEGFSLLAELALDLRSTWNHATDDIWQALDPDLWALTQNPWVVLQTASKARIEQVLADAEFRQQLDQLLQARRESVEADAWFQQAHPQSPLGLVAYFSMEYMLSEALPIYSGGLGNVAGDQLKACSDLGIPLVGVGLLYQQGYFRQVVDAEGHQHALYPYNDPGQLPITPLRRPDGQWLRLQINLPGHTVWLRAWQANVGRVKLYLLDSNDPANYPAYRTITSELYGGGPELRLMQELILGIGGWRLLMELGLQPDVCHLNEGHAAFAVLERTKQCMQQTGLSFEAALSITRVGNLFTTHTAVAAGFDLFEPQLIERYLGRYAMKQLGISVDTLLALGRQHASDAGEPFNMAYLALRGSGAVNGVSQLHGEVSRHIFAPLFPHWPEHEVPVMHITNGVHMPTWDSAPADALWSNACGKSRWLGLAGSLQEDICEVADEQLWEVRVESTKSLVEYVRARLARQLAGSGASMKDIEAARHMFDPAALTIGFARRFATYKRPNLLLHDPDCLTQLLTNSERPVQLIIAGKAHPADQAGQALIRQWFDFLHRPEIRQHVIFLTDYDMLLSQHLVQGVDVWLNTPRRPWEASGTSGMKVLVNGGLNLSELDGWWAEAYTPEVGWAIGDGGEHGENPDWDAKEAEELYDLLETRVIPEFYDRNHVGLPTQWIQRMRASMSTLTPKFSAARTVIDYTEQCYIPAALRFQQRGAVGDALGTSIVNWQNALREKWASLRFGELRIKSNTAEHRFEVEVFLDGLDPHFVNVELYAEGRGNHPPLRQPMRRGTFEGRTPHWYTYQGSVAATRSAAEITPRLVPFHEGVSVPLEVPWILWQK